MPRRACAPAVPALIVACIFIAFLLGPLVASVPLHTYFTDPRTWLYGR